MAVPEIDALRAVVEAQSALVKDLTAVIGANARQAGQSPISQLKELIELTRELQPPPAPPPGTIAPGVNPWVAIADRLAGAFETILSRQPAPAAALPPGKPRVTVPEWAAPLLPWIPQLVKAATSGLRPELAAGQVAAEMPPDLLDQVRPILAMDGYPSNVLGVFPDLQRHQEWVTAFLFALRGQLNGAGTPGVAAAGGRRPRQPKPGA